MTTRSARVAPAAPAPLRRFASSDNALVAGLSFEVHVAPTRS